MSNGREVDALSKIRGWETGRGCSRILRRPAKLKFKNMAGGKMLIGKNIEKR
jgi:hypothetical protein